MRRDAVAGSFNLTGADGDRPIRKAPHRLAGAALSLSINARLPRSAAGRNIRFRPVIGILWLFRPCFTVFYNPPFRFRAAARLSTAALPSAFLSANRQ